MGRTRGCRSPPGAVRPMPDIRAVARNGPLAGLLDAALLPWSWGSRSALELPGPHAGAQRTAWSRPAYA